MNFKNIFKKKFVKQCCGCSKILNERDEWVEKKFFELINSEISHGICSDCLKRLYPEFKDKLCLKK